MKLGMGHELPIPFLIDKIRKEYDNYGISVQSHSTF